MKSTVLIAALLVFVLLSPHNIAAQSDNKISACEYREQLIGEPFPIPSIAKDEIRQCLQSKTPIKNHHVVFEDYCDAWQELAEETGNYAIPLLIEGGVLHADRPFDSKKPEMGGIRLTAFRDPSVDDVADLTDKQRTTLSITGKEGVLVLIRSPIQWRRVFIDSVLLGSEIRRDDKNKIFIVKSTFSKESNFSDSTFREVADFQRSVFSKKSDFTRSTFREETDFSDSTFREVADFRDSTFREETDFSGSAFLEVSDFRRSTFKVSDFQGSIFSKVADFSGSIFREEAYFSGSIFREGAAFQGSIFRGEAYFNGSTFSKEAYFNGSIFREGAAFQGSIFSKEAYFSGSIFKEITNFSGSTFRERVNFSGSTFRERVNFSGSTFRERVNFKEAQFDENADFRNIIVTETLILDDTTWGNRTDFRSMSVKELGWNSTQSPSNVKGVFDFREATIGSGTFKEVRFQDLVDFSRTKFGQYKVDLRAFWEVLELVNIDFDSSQPHVLVTDLSPQVHFENNTFEKEADFLQVTFDSSALFVNNRFRSTLDLTGSTFSTDKSRLCLSNNRIQRLVIEPENMGNPPSLSPYTQWSSLSTKPLKESKIQPVTNGKCMLVNETTSIPNGKSQRNETLDNIYKTLGKSFRESNDRVGINESYYLETLAKRGQVLTWSILWNALSLWFNEVRSFQTVSLQDQEDYPSKTPPLTWSSVWATLSWLFGDVPSRYSIDVSRTLWISVSIMIIFYIIYMAVLGGFFFLSKPWHFILWHFNPTKKNHRVGRNRMVQIPLYAERHKSFRFRLFEPLHITGSQSNRLVIPWWDAAMISIRAFLKLGLGVRYPNTNLLKALMYLEWTLGVFMLIHFLLAVKNNLPFILPFLGVVN